MKIDDRNLTNSVKLARGQKTEEIQKRTLTGGTPRSTGDRLEISSTSLEMQQLRKAVASSPDLRSGRVEMIREDLQEGTYRIDNESLARAILEEHLGG